MYGGGHLLTSGMLAAVCASKLKKPFPLLVAVAFLTNTIDLDHLFYFRLDNGTANSLALHPLHKYAGVPLFGLFLVAVFSLKGRPWAAMAIGAYTLHLSADALAYWLGYSIPWLLSLDVLFLILAYFVLLKTFVTSPGYVWCYFFIGTILANGVSAFIHFTLKIDPQSSYIPWIVPHFVNVAITAGFIWLFWKPART